LLIGGQLVTTDCCSERSADDRQRRWW